ncbi:hypothetical protein Aph02nite_00610 [Actinoplanes philippinensis]|uniref:Uncharacterized protein n=1 Tax=Actinoplanes philippinensis TaxID=35752 RepID=A0A1I2HK01_9ACTN|nr:hypothetical protein [Actinoplanes philippinensis]GIE74111.1 hypothetical protein Aph02nite_00610 [Actinoplanes philippinensis]SFF30645.1 hypothetical protein SAMN05421541_108320 [Actinoplanes philippinensis]
MTQVDVAEAGAGVPRGWIRAVVGVQLYVLVSYVATAVVPYLWAPRAYPPLWLWVVPGWLLGVPGYFITTAGAVLAVPLAVLGVAVAVAARRRGSARLAGWSAGAAVLTTLYAIFSLTPPGLYLIGFVAD